ncbi:MAG: hypothetical protein JWN52_6846, partial [Actinomycetia bacterium]|nr:hypothetical protein [Actinomycetes bacterium]
RSLNRFCAPASAWAGHLLAQPTPQVKAGAALGLGVLQGAAINHARIEVCFAVVNQ